MTSLCNEGSFSDWKERVDAQILGINSVSRSILDLGGL